MVRGRARLLTVFERHCCAIDWRSFGTRFNEVIPDVEADFSNDSCTVVSKEQLKSDVR